MANTTSMTWIIVMCSVLLHEGGSAITAVNKGANGFRSMRQPARAHEQNRRLPSSQGGREHGKPSPNNTASETKQFPWRNPFFGGGFYGPRPPFRPPFPYYRPPYYPPVYPPVQQPATPATRPTTRATPPPTFRPVTFPQYVGTTFPQYFDTTFANNFPQQTTPFSNIPFPNIPSGANNVPFPNFPPNNAGQVPFPNFPNNGQQVPFPNNNLPSQGTFIYNPNGINTGNNGQGVFTFNGQPGANPGIIVLNKQRQKQPTNTNRNKPQAPQSSNQQSPNQSHRRRPTQQSHQRRPTQQVRPSQYRPSRQRHV